MITFDETTEQYVDKNWPGSLQNLPSNTGRVCLHPYGQSVLFESSTGRFYEWDGKVWNKIDAEDLA